MRKGPLDAQIENFLAKVFDFIKLNEPDSNELSNDLETLQASISTVLEELQVAAEELHQQNEIILEAQTQLTEETQRYQNLFESAPDAYLVTDKLGIIQQANQAAVNLLNIPPEHIVEKPLTTHLDGESLMKMLHAMSRLISGKDKRVQWESQFSPRRLSPIPVMISAVIQDEGEGKLPHILWLIRNISDTKRAERESRESQARYNTIFNAAPLGILLLDLSGRILDSNHAFHQISGYSEEDMRGFTYPEPFLPEDLASEAAFFLPHVEDEPKQYEVDHRLRRKDGQTIWVHSTWTLLRDNEGKPIYLLGLLEDVTPLRERDEEIIQLGQLLDESVEKERENLARDLHDGPLQHQFGIIYHLQQIAQSQNDPELIEGLAEIREELEQVIGMLRMTSGLLRSPTLAHFGLIRGILAYIEQTQMNNPDLNIHAEISHEDGDLSTRVQQGIYRIFQHCLTNAIRHSQASNIVVRLWENDTRLNLEVEDDGAGFDVPPHWLELTKGGHYGLIGSAERAAALGGLLKIRSTPGAGTTVRVEIPLNEDAQKKQSLANLGAEIPRF